jgi:hypothetical protein
MNIVFLVPDLQPSGPVKPGLNSVGTGSADLPTSDWVPDLKKLRPAALPTPLAQAEAARTFISLWKEVKAPTAAVRLFDQMQLLIKGIVLGHLQVVINDLKGLGRLGAALENADPRFRFMGLLKSVDGGGTVFGGTSPYTMVWPHARLAQADWDQLRRRVDGDKRAGRLSKLIADFRSVLQRKNCWDDNVPWMKLLRWMVGDQEEPSTGASLLRRDSRFCGPLLLQVAGDPAKDETYRRIYLPVLDEGFAGAFLDWCHEKVEATGDSVLFKDPRGTVVASISLPDADDRLALGAGVVRRGGAPAPRNMRAEWKLRSKEMLAALEPIRSALAAEVTRRGGNPSPKFGPSLQEVLSGPVFYPDPWRILADMLGPVVTGEVSYSPAVLRLLQDNKLASLPSPEEIAGDASLGLVLHFQKDGGSMYAAYLHRTEGYSDLVAIGYALFRAFCGEGIPGERDDRTTVLRSRSGGALLIAGPERPVDPSEEVVNAVSADGPRPGSRRLATIQRFARSYSEGTGQSRAEEAVLAQKAALAFAAWATAGQLDGEISVTIGQPARKDWKELSLPTGLKLAYPTDPFLGEEK